MNIRHQRSGKHQRQSEYFVLVCFSKVEADTGFGPNVDLIRNENDVVVYFFLWLVGQERQRESLERLR
jgi:hypothetical protein